MRDTFLGVSADHFSEDFLGPVEQDHCTVLENQDDGFGYYEDGVQRTLTDEQITMFRHSEIQTILRERRHKKEAEVDSGLISSADDREVDIEDGEVEDEELQEREIAAATPEVSRQSRKRKRKKSKQNHPAKPDLRKRTWDKVDEGLAGLDYDEATGVADGTRQLYTQRRRISYNDD
ncbi:hypothetical protein B7463_g12530, partial [Scytalidium lignicola]